MKKNFKYTVYVNGSPEKNFDSTIDAEDFIKSISKTNNDITCWDNENECEFHFFNDSVIFDEVYPIGELTRNLKIYRFNYKILAQVFDKNQNGELVNTTTRNFMLTKSFPNYRQLVEKAKKHFEFAQ